MSRVHVTLLSLSLALAAGCGDDDGGVTDAPGTDAGPLTWDPPAHCTGGALAEPIAGCAPARLPSTGDPAQDCVDRINQLRAECQCMPPLARWRDGERCAEDQARYDSTRMPHAGFRDRICDGGFGQNECPGWPSTDAVIEGCLQNMWDEGPGEDFQMHGHYINMTNPSHSQVACGFADVDGEIWAVQNFR